MIQKALGILILLFVSHSYAQKTVVFNGKTYLVYPQEIDNSESRSTPYLYLDYGIAVGGISFPPVIGSMPDGEYLIYSNSYNYIKKGGRGKHTIYDTVQVVYGTFTIKNNQKQGEAVVYERYHQSWVNSKVHYENDLLEGVLKIDLIDREEYDNIPDYITRPAGRYIDLGNSFADIRFSKGLLVDKLSLYYATNKKDTLLYKRIEVKNGVRHGKYEVSFFEKKKKKILRYSSIKGEFENGFMAGRWENRRKDHLVDLRIYNSGRITYKKHHWYYTDTADYIIESYGKDSVLKYFPDYKNERTKSFIGGYYISEGTDSFQLIKEQLATGNFMYFRAYGNISAGYGRDYDTIVNGRVLRVSKGYHRIEKKWYKDKKYIVVDTFLKDDYTHYHQIIFRELYDEKSNKFIKNIYEDEYYKYFFRDSLRPEQINEKKHKRYNEAEFYQRALDYNYSNLYFKKGSAKNYSIYYEVSGGVNNGSVIKIIKIPAAYDTIYLIDTLMRNGEFLYQGDAFFNYGYYGLMQEKSGYENDRERGSMLADKIYDFLEAGPIKHQTLMLGKVRYKGRLNLEIHYTNKPKKVKAVVYEYRENILDIFEKRLSIDILVERRKSGLSAGRNTSFIIPSSYRFVKYENGLLNGNVAFTDFKRQMTFESYYSDNRLSYTVHTSPNRFKSVNQAYQYDDGYDFFNTSTYSSKYSYKKEITKDNTYPVNGSLMQFEEGLKKGQWMMYNNGQLYQTYNFQNNMQNGQQLTFNTGEYHTLSYVYTMQNDTVNGKVYELFPDGLPERTGSYKMGIPHGCFTNYNPGSDTALYYKQRFLFDHGYLVGNYTEYRDSYNLKMRILFNQKDSINYDEVGGAGNYIIEGGGTREVRYTIKRNMSGYEFINALFRQTQFRKGYYQYYYSSGYLFKQGNKEYDQPVGHWKVYREGADRLYKTIDFKDSLLFANTPDSLHTFGLVKAYYDNGQLMFTGLATDYGFKYSCESDASMPTENDFYLNFYDTLGKPMLNNGNGFISELQANGNKLKEGKIVNNKKEGIWIYYSKFGLPEEIGIYKDGKKTGRWLSGDLGGLNLDEKVCFMTDEEFRGWVSAFGGNLNLQEEYYESGELVNTSSVNTIKR